MYRKKVWVEAKEKYLIKLNIEDQEVIENMSDSEIEDLYNRIVEERGLEDEADKFLHSYCITYR